VTGAGNAEAGLDRKPDARVNSGARATWTNNIGDPDLMAVWTDPDFDPAACAFHFARVVETQTPRWTAYDARRFGVPMTPAVPMVTNERAHTSPIRCTPQR